MCLSTCRARLAVKDRESSYLNDGRVFGTWDFKWPQGHTIKVAFQALQPRLAQELEGAALNLPEPSREEAALLEGKTGFERLTRLVECLARRWLAEKPNIHLKFEHEPLPPPLDGDSKSIWNGNEVTYDVLVSLAPLPQYRKLHGAPAAKDPKFFLPGSELGRYAQRVDYGVPTTYLGKRQHCKDSLIGYFNSPEFRHWALHEFGHVFGLPHEHQNPNIHSRILNQLLDDENELVARLQNALEYPADGSQDITAAEVQEEILQEWPVVHHPEKPDEVLRELDGKICYSDFRDWEEVPDDSQSIMFHVYWKRLLKPGIGDASETAGPSYFERPTASDVKHLKAMYP